MTICLPCCLRCIRARTEYRPLMYLSSPSNASPQIHAMFGSTQTTIVEQVKLQRNP